jgi:phosphoglycolate phosphatase
MKFYGFDDAKAEEAVEKYREYFRPHGVYENEVYEGVPEMLKALRASGKTLILATSKPTVFAEIILDHFGLRQYFDVVVGSELDGRRVNKDEVVACALEEAKIGDKSQAVMIGDREHDIMGGKKNGLAAIGVLYGHGSREELQRTGADVIVETVAELQEVLM